MTYLYMPDDDSEYGPIWEESEALETFTAEELANAIPAVLVASALGHWGHYLAEHYLREAISIVRDEIPTEAMSDTLRGQLSDWSLTARTYSSHNDIFSTAGPSRGCRFVMVHSRVTFGARWNMTAQAINYPPMAYERCAYCEWIHETADEAESVISELGYVTTWGDGYSIYKLEGDAK